MSIQDDHIERAIMAFGKACEEYYGSKHKKDISNQLLEAKADSVVQTKAQLTQKINELIDAGRIAAQEESDLEMKELKGDLEEMRLKVEEHVKSRPFDMLRDRIGEDLKQLLVNVSYVEKVLERQRLVGTDQNPSGWRDLLTWCVSLTERLSKNIEKVGK